MTRLEVIGILLVSLFVVLLIPPFVVSSRENARKAQCLKNIRDIGQAFQSFASSRGGKLPPLTGSLKIKNSSNNKGELTASWQILLLPALQQSAVLAQIQANAVVESGKARFGDDKRPMIGLYRCPSNLAAHQRPERIDFVANAGFFSQDLYHGDPDRRHLPGSLAWVGSPGDAEAVAVHVATGVLWHQSDRFESSLDYVSEGDGSSTTLLLAENLQAGNWSDTDATTVGFWFPVPNTNGQVPLGPGQVFESAERPLYVNFYGAVPTTSQEWRINADLKSATGALPRPSSQHTGGVNTLFCDGAGRFLNQSIDPHIYLNLLTANGVSYGEGHMGPSSY